MIEVYAPFVLLLMSWYPADPQDSMEVSQRVLIGYEECMAAGREIEQLRAENPTDNRTFAWRCVPQQREIEIHRPPAEQP